MLRAVVAAVVVFAGALPSAFGGTIKGTGIHRPDEASCVRSLAAFNKRLNAQGLTLLKKTECEPVDGEPNAYAPVFTAKAQDGRTLVPETAVTIYQPTRKHCEKMLGDLLKIVADDNETIMESGCVSLTILDALDPEKITEQFQPMVFLLKEGDRAIAADELGDEF